MNALFSQLLRQSLAAGWVILALLLLRPFLKKVPKFISCFLWALAAVRLAVPITVKSPVSLVPERIADPVRTLPVTPVQVIPITPEAVAPAAQSAAQSFSWEALLPWLWLAGAVAMAVYALYSYVRLMNRVQVSIRMGDRLYICDNIVSPFILGIFRPRIYLPSEMDQAQANLVLAHERSHLRRGDHLWKPLGYGLLCLHWFNPLCWAAYLLFCRDMEQACDESVVKDMSAQDKKAYSAALVRCSVPRSDISACPLAFGEVGVKQRIQGILNYRKPRFWMLAICALLCGVLAVGFLTNPVAEAEETKGEVPLYITPSRNAQQIHQLDPQEDDTVRCMESIGDDIWAYVQGQGDISGWMLLDAEEAARLQMSIHRVNTENLIGEIVSFPQEATVYSAPHRSARVLAQYPAGMPITIYSRETIGDDTWGLLMGQNGEIYGWILLDGTEEALPTRSNGVGEPGTFTQQTTLYSAPSRGSREVGQGAPGEAYQLTRRESIGNDIWGYVECQDGNVRGWILLDGTEAAQPALPNGVGEPGTFTQQTTLYSAPSRGSREVGQGAPGETYQLTRRESIGNDIWGYVECQDGNVRGWILLDGTEENQQIVGTVIGPKNLNIRSGPGTDYAIVSFLTPGSQVSIYEVVTLNDQQWGRVGGDSWVCMDYIQWQKENTPNLPDEAEIQHSAPGEMTEELYTFPRQTSVYSTPNERAAEAGQGETGAQCAVLRREFINGGSWGYVRLQNGTQGWVHFLEDDEALAYFSDYVAAFSQPTPDEVEEYLYFASDYAREFFRDSYSPATGWYPSGIFRVNENLWGIQFASPLDERTAFSFVGRMDDRLYVFQNARQVPEELSENLDAAAYEEENAMYLSEGYLECVWVQKRLLEFRNPTKVELWEDGDSSAWGTISDGNMVFGPMSFEDMVCGTDTWRVAESLPNGQAHCIITLTARDGSTARFWDVDGSVLVCRPDGTQEIYRVDFTGEETISMLYHWAKELAEG